MSSGFGNMLQLSGAAYQWLRRCIGDVPARLVLTVTRDLAEAEMETTAKSKDRNGDPDVVDDVIQGDEDDQDCVCIGEYSGDESTTKMDGANAVDEGDGLDGLFAQVVFPAQNDKVDKVQAKVDVSTIPDDDDFDSALAHFPF